MAGKSAQGFDMSGVIMSEADLSKVNFRDAQLSKGDGQDDDDWQAGAPAKRGRRAESDAGGLRHFQVWWWWWWLFLSLCLPVPFYPLSTTSSSSRRSTSSPFLSSSTFFVLACSPSHACHLLPSSHPATTKCQ